MHKMGFPTHIILLIKALYDQQKAAVRTSYGLTEWLEIGQGVRQGCIISPHLFNIYADAIMRNALENFEGSVTVGGHKLTNLRYADDVVLIAGALEELQGLIDRVRLESEKVGLFLSTKKAKVMKVQQNPSDGGIVIDRETVETVTKFKYLGAIFTSNGDDSTEVKRRLCIAKNATVALGKIWKDKNISLATKKQVLQTLVFPIASYGAECWVLKACDKKRLENFEMWCCRRVLRISWTETITNEEVLEKIDCERRFITVLDSRKLTFIGYQLRKGRTLEKTLLLGSVYGKRLRGRPKTRLRTTSRRSAG